MKLSAMESAIIIGCVWLASFYTGCVWTHDAATALGSSLPMLLLGWGAVGSINHRRKKSA